MTYLRRVIGVPAPGAVRYYRNHYECTACPHEWVDEMHIATSSYCPCCDGEIEPYSSEELYEEDE